LAERLRVRRSCSDERVVGQSGNLTKRRPREAPVVSSVGGVDVVVRSRMLSACCTQHPQSQSRPAAVVVTLFPNCRSCVVTPQGRRSTSADPDGTYVVLASGCGANSWRTLLARGAAVGVILTSSGSATGLPVCWGLSACCRLSACCGDVILDGSSGSSTEQSGSAAHFSLAACRASVRPHHSGGDQVTLVPGARSSAGGGVCSCDSRGGRGKGSATSPLGTGRGGEGGSGGNTSNSCVRRRLGGPVMAPQVAAKPLYMGLAVDAPAV